MTEQRSTHAFRVARFVVPTAGRDEFVARLQRTHDLIAEQPGVVQDFLLEQSGGPGEFNVVTIVEWENEKAIEAARGAVEQAHADRGFDPEALFERLDVTPDFATYELIGGSANKRP